MNLVKKILLGVLVISFLTFVALFGRLPGLRRTPIGWLYRALCLHAPRQLRRFDTRLTGGIVTLKSQRLGRYVFYENNPIVLIIFLVLLTGSASLFLYNGWSRIDYWQKCPIPILLGLPYFFTYKCVSYESHYVQPANHVPRMQDYPYDHAIYRPGKICSTCNLVKPARSKHCSLCGYCVAKCDHHCPWVMNCLGRGNYHHFLALLLSLGALQSYGAYLSYYILRAYLRLPRNPNVWNLSWKRVSEFGDMCTAALQAGGLGIAGVGLLAAATALLPLSFLAYHIYLIWAGMTTNESQKWADLRDDMAEGSVFRASHKALLEHLRLQQEQDTSAALPLSRLIQKLGLEWENTVHWPAETDQVIVRTNDCQPPSGQAHLWSKVYNLSDIVNLYDLGMLDNLSEILGGK